MPLCIQLRPLLLAKGGIVVTFIIVMSWNSIKLELYGVPCHHYYCCRVIMESLLLLVLVRTRIALEIMTLKYKDDERKGLGMMLCLPT